MKRIINISTVAGILLVAGVVLIGFQKQIFISPEALQGYLLQFGIWAPLIFIVIQVAQVVFPIIPGGLTCVAGVLCFGAVGGFIYNYVSICIGSCINFLLIRRYGKPLLLQLSSQKIYDKYIGWVEKGERFDRFFALAIFLPVAPDDFLCMLAGLTKMSFRRFLTIIVLGKPLSILAYSMGVTTILVEVINFMMR